MLKSILNLEGVRELGRNEVKEINGGWNGICPGEGDACDPNEPILPCLGGPEILCCVNGVLVSVGVTVGCLG
jgi:hypothetical protein